MAEKMSRFEDLLQFLADCSVKELRNEELTAESMTNCYMAVY